VAEKDSWQDTSFGRTSWMSFLYKGKERYFTRIFHLIAGHLTGMIVPTYRGHDASIEPI